MRLGFAIAAFLQADVLLLDEVFAVGDENFQRKCFGVIAAFKNQGGTILFVSHDAQAVERLCERSILLSAGGEGLRRADARGDCPLPAAPRRRSRPGRAGRRPARVGDGRGRDRRARGCSTPNGDERQQFLAGEPLRLEVDLRDHAAVEPPLLHLEVRDTTGLLVAETAVDTATVGWPRSRRDATVGARCRTVRPLAFGRFRVRLGLVAADGRTLHQFDDALSFLVYPDGEERGLVQLGGTWRVAANEELR